MVRKRVSRRAEERAARKPVRDRETLTALSRGSSDHRIHVPSAAAVETRARNSTCPHCEGTYRIEEHASQSSGLAIAVQADEVVKARALSSSETDPTRKEALEHVLHNSVTLLGRDIDDLISDLAPPELGSDMTKSPGRYQIIRDAMAPVLSLRGAKTADTALASAKTAIERVRWTLEHAPEIIKAQTKGQTLEDVKAEEKPGENTT
ncbi:MAG TPA: hypothetical protein VMJ10_27280 [Kofleriaceae bacterium]|nr:hypothetical protein [Kofleriaceae bacterium]